MDNKSAEIDNVISKQVDRPLRFSPECRNLISYAISLLGQKQAHKDELSTTTLLLAATELGRSRWPDDAPKHKDYLAELYAFVQSNNFSNTQAYRSVLDDFFESIPLLDVTDSQVPKHEFMLTENMRTIVRRAHDRISSPADSSNKSEGRLGEVHITELLLELFDHTGSDHYVGGKITERLERLGTNSKRLSEFTLNYMMDNPAGEREPDTYSLESPLWLCQYRESDNPGLERRMRPGAVQKWLLGKQFKEQDISNLRVGDQVVVWRTISKGKFPLHSRERGGIVGWAKISDLGLLSASEKISDKRIRIQYEQVFPNNPISRDTIVPTILEKVSGLTEYEEKGWPGQVATKLLLKQERDVLLEYYRPELEPNPFLEQWTDHPETTKDFLDRGPLAFTLAQQINKLFAKPAQKEKVIRGLRPLSLLKNGLLERGGFSRTSHENAPVLKDTYILHVDSPWGGGKTTFANYVARILNPDSSKFEINLDEEKSDPESIFSKFDLDNTDRWPPDFREREWLTVEYNAWRNQHVTPPWWNFYDTIRRQCNQQLSFVARWCNRSNELCWRVFTPDVLRTLLVLALAIPIILQLPKIVEYFGFVDGSNASNGDSTALAILSVFGIAGGSLVALVRSFQSGIRKVIISAGDSIDPSSLGQSDPLNRFRNRFQETIKRYGDSRPVLVIVDDLDRCKPEFVVELLRGMLTIFRAPNVVFLLLGDRIWIEKSFGIVHANLSGIYDTLNRSFGSRFVEKAIQMSYILPEPDERAKESYLKRILRGPALEQPELSFEINDETLEKTESLTEEDKKKIELTKMFREFESRTRDEFKGENLSGKDIQSAIFRAERDAEEKFGEYANFGEQAVRFITRQSILSTAASEKIEDVVSEELLQLNADLPKNPRRIKRIINMILLYQASAEWQFRFRHPSVQWRQLVLWVVLMSEYPKAWKTLCLSPEVADDILADSYTDAASPILTDEHVTSLIRGGAYSRQGVCLDTYSVNWLRRLTPLDKSRT